MSINNIVSNGINNSNYIKPTETKKVDNKSDGTSESTNGLDVTLETGTDKYIKSTEQDTNNPTYKPVKKKLSPDEIKALRDDQDNQKAEFVRKFIRDTIDNQNKLLKKAAGSNVNDSSKASTDLLTKIFGSLDKAYPPLATTQEGAQQAIAEGGAYSVNAVADRIMTMAQAIAGDDPNKLQQMRAAVEKGFSQAGVDFKAATKSDLPQISKDTMDEVMRRFDDLQNVTSNTN